jgi:membrane fusion protein (multidrug efflux system)
MDDTEEASARNSAQKAPSIDNVGNGDKGDQKGKPGDRGQNGPKSRTPIIILIVVAGIAIIGGLIFWLMTRNQESTDDAYTEGNAVSIAPKSAETTVLS